MTKIRESFEDHAFGEKVDLADPAMIKAISYPVTRPVTVKAFVTLLQDMILDGYYQPQSKKLL